MWMKFLPLLALPHGSDDNDDDDNNVEIPRWDNSWLLGHSLAENNELLLGAMRAIYLEIINPL